MEVLWPPQNINACVGEQDMIILMFKVGRVYYLITGIDGVAGTDTLLIGTNVPNMFIPTDNPDNFEYEMTVTDDCNNTISYFLMSMLLIVLPQMFSLQMVMVIMTTLLWILELFRWCQDGNI